MTEAQFEDISITCECGNDFIFSAGEQSYYERNGYQTPKRCKPCRLKKKQLRAEQAERES